MRVEGKGGIWAEVVADSINAWGDRVTSFRLHYHRFIHAEFLRHRMFSNSVSSSRAIPVPKMLEQVKENPATPIYWGKNQAGMSAKEEIEDTFDANMEWQEAIHWGTESATNLHSMEVHKQITNRLVEPFQFINQVVTATDFDNFYYLRIHADAQPEIQELANVMYEAQHQSIPDIRRNSWHLPFVTEEMRIDYGIVNAKKISASMCAQASYRVSDDSLEKAEMIYDKLVTSRPLHASPFEHVCLPFSEDEMMARRLTQGLYRQQLERIYDDKGLVEMQVRQLMYNGNFRGWTQMRKHINDENYTRTFVK